MFFPISDFFYYLLEFCNKQGLEARYKIICSQLSVHCPLITVHYHSAYSLSAAMISAKGAFAASIS